MAVLFNQKEFEKLIIKKGKEFGDLVTAKAELDKCKIDGILEYVFYVYQFCKTLIDNNILYLVRFEDCPSRIMEILGMDDSSHFDSELQSKKYGRDKKKRFSIYIPTAYKDEVIDLFCQIASCSIHSNEPLTLYFGKDDEYRIDLIQHHYLGKLSKINKDAINDIHPNDQAVINYMIQIDDKGYYMPNLYGCVFGSTDFWYSLINAAQPKNIEDLFKVISLAGSIFNDQKLLIKHIKDYGLDDIICCREELYQILCDGYEIPLYRVDSIRFNLNHFHHLSESDELFLQSNEVPEYIIAQLRNISHLFYAVHSVVTLELIYKLAYIKFYYRDDFLNSLPSFLHQAYVGPFFYIDGVIHASLESIKTFKPDLRFFDSETTHYFYFFSLQMDGDYGNYPRGRVTYDNYHQQFIVYLDRCLMKKEIEEKIKFTYLLGKEKVVFKSDPQYTHDGL